MRLPALLRRSVRAKLTALVAVTTLAALLVTAVALIYYSMRDYGEMQLADVRTQADILGRASAAALAFNDPKEGQQDLALLKARPDVEQAALYAANGSLFAAYSRSETPAVPTRAGESGHRTEGGRLKLFHPVFEGGQLLGTVYIEYRDRLRERLAAFVLILVLVMAAALGAAFVLSTWLQRAVTIPILDVAAAARSVLERGDFHARARKSTDDEIGALADALNRMLAEIGSRTSALVESEERFRTIANSAPVLIWMNDEAGAVFVNKAYLDFLGVSDQIDVRGYDWAQYVHPEDRERYVSSYVQATNENKLFAAEFRFRRRDGQYRWMRSVAVPRLTAEGGRLGYTGCTFDVHDARVAVDALRLADRRKDEFLATLAHELRNPLAPIRNALHLLQMATDDPTVAAEARAMIERNVVQMVRLVDDLLDVSRIATGKLVLRRARVELRAIFAATLEAAMPLIQERGHRLNAKTPPPGISIDADATRLVQVLLNLLNNAAKFTAPGGHIDFSVNASGAALIASVRDDGIGIAPEMLSEIFEMFVQADRSLERTNAGLGVGLALSRRLVEMHGGTLEAKSEGLGKGAEFIVRIPGIVTEAAPSRVAEKASGVTASACRILVVDDNRDFADSTAALLGALGHDVRVAYDGMAGLHTATQFTPQVAFLDVGMPTMNGYDLARRLRGQPATAGTTLVAISGWGQANDRRRALEAGFDEFLVKPVDPKLILMLLERTCH